MRATRLEPCGSEGAGFKGPVFGISVGQGITVTAQQFREILPQYFP
jgi:hypothetical protein